MIQYFRNISSISAISKIVEIRKYRLKEDFSQLTTIDDVKKMLAFTYESTGIDITDLSEPLGHDSIEKIEKFLQDALGQTFKNKSSESFLGDELTLLADAIDFSVTDFKNLPISTASIEQSAKIVFKALGYIAPSISNIVKDLYKF